MNKTHREILKIAVPSIVTNITVPLLGLVDLAITGHLADASGRSAVMLGAISVGTLVFNMVYWIFTFLRIGTSGLTAQAFGRGDVAAQRQVLRRGVGVGLAGGLLLLLLQVPLAVGARWLVGSSAEVWRLAMAYFRIRIWAAPAVLSLFAINGWLIGMQNSVYPMLLAVVQNLVNIAVSCLCVYALHMGIEGVALGTALSQYVGLLLVAAMLWHRYRFVFGRADKAAAAAEAPSATAPQPVTLRQFFSVNLDIMLRMVLMIVVTSSVTAIGARNGDLLLAVNTLLMQLFTIFSYFTDGFAAAGEALAGKYIGRRDLSGLRSAVRGLFVWGAALALLFTLVYASGGMPLLALLTDDALVLDTAREYLPWAVAIPLLSFAAFVWDGIYIGATATHLMLATIAVGAAAFAAVWYGLPMLSGNHRLWLAFVVWLAVRSLVQTFFAPRVVRL